MREQVWKRRFDAVHEIVSPETDSTVTEVINEVRRLKSIERVRNEERWRKYPEEKPEKTGEYLVQMDDNDNCGPYFTSHLYSSDCGWSIQIGQSILRWKPITLPDEVK